MPPLASPASLGTPRLHLRRIDSTSDRARELALAGAPHGTLVTADEQTSGRGRQGRSWSAPPGSALLMSLVLRSPPPLLPLIAALAVSDVAGEPAQIKWPNDIVLVQDGRLAKLAGILAEGRPQEGWAVLGIGLNVAVRVQELPPELHASAATLGLTPAEVEPALAQLLAALELRLGQDDEATLAAWRQRDALRGREVSWSAGRGRAEGIDGTGRLIVALADGGRAALDAGEVHLLSG
ncbi:MAG TPA: biotin--[acetyl-CoA-carboxylase] ligase [Solirubrobacteraceae bacterium]|jgi:BirA family biotin operon repressor/biotin-[acetyl-CoA-carboxylase] ligase|nr:biotin--[acetyl-CoA-carboxylase] ligase [Solirubrobacteraceae bacterium]